MKAIVTGADGQVGRALARTAPVSWQVVTLDRAALDIGDPRQVERVVAAERPDVIINAAAYTSVDRAESEEALALRINGTAVGYLAAAASRHGARLVHISTDFVFDGRQDRPYAPDAALGPLGAYGRTKLAGEQAAGSAALIVRTSWVYAAQGSNFVRTMLRLMAERDLVRVVSDQVGTPTYADGLAETLWELAATDRRGILHWSDSGVASWYDFAVAIQEEALAAGLLTTRVSVIPIATEDYPTPARRPDYSVLDKSATTAALGRAPSHWRDNLHIMIEKLKAHG